MPPETAISSPPLKRGILTNRKILGLIRLAVFALIVCYHHAVVQPVDAIKFVSRKDWGAKAPKSSTPVVGNPKGVKIHYTGGHMSKGGHANCAAKMRQIQLDHQNNKDEGWGDIAYNLGVCQHGYVFEGRGWKLRSGANGNKQLNINHQAVIALVGSSGDTEPSSAMVQGIKDAVTYLRKHGAGNEVLGHKDGWATQCPGGPLYQLLKAGKLTPGAGGGGGGGGSGGKGKYVGFPGASWFGRRPKSSIVTAMGKRLVAEGCSAYKVGPGPQWTDADRKSYALWQKKLGYKGKDADGWPGKTSWDKLKVPM
ncbi:hypothetical protein FQN52_006066 [Onygenales sp. PD_12]|nr:hypothetical protein FQN52_006066 [Onygenales sp. PD_12]